MWLELDVTNKTLREAPEIETMIKKQQDIFNTNEILTESFVNKYTRNELNILYAELNEYLNPEVKKWI